MLTFKVLSSLLCYPTGGLIAALPELSAVIEQEPLLAKEQKGALKALMADLRQSDLMALQERYVQLFDRGRVLSLHLFEHIHGESRDRGQAMVDLTHFYEANGYQIDARELPDYLPLFLEFLAQIPAPEALEQLQNTLPILSLLGARLAERQNAYCAVFEALTHLCGASETPADVRALAASEGPDEMLERMDEIWEEEAVTFMATPGSCSNKADQVHPLRFQKRSDKTQSPIV
jgi:nitrate reductase molybdenum cofactor assembly chaperone NarJ/NarW